VGALVSQSLRDALSGPWAIFLGRMTTDEAILRRAAALFEKSFDRGQVSATALGDGRFRLILSGWSDPHPMDIESIKSAIETLLAIVERPAVVVANRKSDGTVEFHVTARIAVV
jgi:GGDEF domain-containing protein